MINREEKPTPPPDKYICEDSSIAWPRSKEEIAKIFEVPPESIRSEHGTFKQMKNREDFLKSCLIDELDQGTKLYKDGTYAGLTFGFVLGLAAGMALLTFY